jgi:hypothetical protein
VCALKSPIKQACKSGTDCGIGQPTCNNSNSMIDYALISPTLFRSVIDFNVLTFDPILSDIHKHTMKNCQRTPKFFLPWCLS